ncbi:MAG: DUF4062 domain-containing protein [Candidatus Humimicrobiaceae bacterium]
MSKPKIFLSSTFYEFEQIREDLEDFIKSLGYEPILCEKGDITYGKDASLEEYCYKEVEDIDILIALIGGKYGNSSKYNNHSITQQEIKTALDKNKQVYIFIKNEVYVEFNTYKANKDNLSVNYPTVDDKRIFDFIENIKSLPVNNIIYPFNTNEDIKRILKKQWAGLFYNLLKKQNEYFNNNIIYEPIPMEENYYDEYQKYPYITGEFLHNKIWYLDDNGIINENTIDTDLDGDGQKEKIIFGRHTPNGTKLQVLIGKDLFELSFDIKGLDEYGEIGNSCQLAIKDVDNDGFSEILFAFETGNMNISELHLNIFKFNREKYFKSSRDERINPFYKIAYFSGYFNPELRFRIINGGKIEIPYGSQGLYDTYVWNGNKFIPDIESELFNIFKKFLESIKEEREYVFFDNKTIKKVGNPEEYKEQKKSDIFSIVRNEFENLENFQLENVKFKNNKFIIMISANTLKGVNKKLKINFIEENKKWKISF